MSGPDAPAWDPAEGSPMQAALEPWRLSALAFPKIHENGRAVFESGKVLDLELRGDGVSGKARGSAGEAYDVELRLAPIDPELGEGAPRRLTASCSCAWATKGGGAERSICKHAVAVGLAAGPAYAARREAAIIAREIGESAPSGAKPALARARL